MLSDIQSYNLDGLFVWLLAKINIMGKKNLGTVRALTLEQRWFNTVYAHFFSAEFPLKHAQVCKNEYYYISNHIAC